MHDFLNETINFKTFKAEFTLSPNEDYYVDHIDKQMGLSEHGFHSWLKGKEITMERILAKANGVLAMKPEKWEFFLTQYERSVTEDYIISKQYPPTGFFETSDQSGNVCCFLPDTYGDKPFRLSFYDNHGPRNHEVFSTRKEAYRHMARKGYHLDHGALDQLVGTKSWNRGLQLLEWISMGVHPTHGLERAKSENQQEILALFDQ